MALCSLPSHLAPASAGSRGSFSLSQCGARYPVSLIWNSAGQKWVTLLMNMHEGPRLLEKHIRLTSSFHNGGCAERSLKVPVVSKTYQLGRKVWQTPFIFCSNPPPICSEVSTLSSFLISFFLFKFFIFWQHCTACGL